MDGCHKISRYRPIFLTTNSAETQKKRRKKTQQDQSAEETRRGGKGVCLPEKTRSPLPDSRMCVAAWSFAFSGSTGRHRNARVIHWHREETDIRRTLGVVQLFASLSPLSSLFSQTMLRSTGAPPPRAVNAHRSMTNRT